MKKEEDIKSFAVIVEPEIYFGTVAPAGHCLSDSKGPMCHHYHYSKYGAANCPEIVLTTQQAIQLRNEGLEFRLVEEHATKLLNRFKGKALGAIP